MDHPADEPGWADEVSAARGALGGRHAPRAERPAHPGDRAVPNLPARDFAATVAFYRHRRTDRSDDTELAEYPAVATLQADVLVTGDRELRRAANGLIPVDGYDALWVDAPGASPRAQLSARRADPLCAARSPLFSDSTM